MRAGLVKTPKRTMLSLADTTALIQETTEQLSGDTSKLSPQAGLALIDQWLEPLSTSENLKPIVAQLEQLKTMLSAPAINNHGVQTRMGEVAELTSTLGATTGSEGEFPSLLDGLAAALRQLSSTSRGE